MEISCAEKIHQACQTNAELHQPADPAKCKVDGPGLKSAQVNQQTHVIVHAMLHNGTPTKKPQKVTAELKSLSMGLSLDWREYENKRTHKKSHFPQQFVVVIN